MDEFGNVQCPKCSGYYAPEFPSCPKCCPHDALNFVEDWHGPDDGGGWELDVVCSVCGKNWWAREEVIRDYKAVRK